MLLMASILKTLVCVPKTSAISRCPLGSWQSCREGSTVVLYMCAVAFGDNSCIAQDDALYIDICQGYMQGCWLHLHEAGYMCAGHHGLSDLDYGEHIFKMVCPFIK